MLGRFSVSRPATANGLAPALEPAVARETAEASSDAARMEAAERTQRKMLDAKVRLHRRLIEEINLSAVDKASEAELRKLVGDLVSEYVLSERLPDLYVALSSEIWRNTPQ